MASRILITGGAGFIGSHLVDDLNPQVHGPARRPPPFLSAGAEFMVGDVRDRAAVVRALRGVDAVYHLAALVGVGQSMYEAAEYASVNTVGTAVLLEAAAASRIRRLVVASSMSIYGEGLYRDARGRPVEGASRTIERLKRGDWEVRGDDGDALVPVATPESKPPSLESIYALTKYDQERSCLMMGRAYGFEVVALRFFNVFGPRQALSNPYTGVLAIFATRVLNGNRPIVFEDGAQLRDFVSVHDVVRACSLALTAPAAAGRAINVGAGRPFAVREIAERVAAALGKPALPPEMAGSCRVGDVRHCYADIGRARELLGYEPQVSFDDGLREYASWLQGQAPEDRAQEARAELESRGLTI